MCCKHFWESNYFSLSFQIEAIINLSCFFKLVITLSKAEQSLADMEIQKKEAGKHRSIQDFCLERVHRLKVSVNSRLKAIQNIDQRKAFYRQIVPKSSCSMNKINDINILVTSTNCCRRIIQSIRIMGRPPMRMGKWNQLSQFT